LCGRDYVTDGLHGKQVQKFNQVVYADFAGPYPLKSGDCRKSMLILVDGFSKLVKIWLVSKPGAEEVVKALQDWTRDYGLISELQTDNGGAFCSRSVEQWARDHGTLQTFSSAYHPQSNGVVERMVGNVKLRIKKDLCSKPGSWISRVSRAVEAINNSVSDSTRFTPNELAWGLRRDGSVASSATLAQWRCTAAENLRRSMEKADQRFSRYRKRNHLLRVGDRVLKKVPSSLKDRRNPFSAPWEGPYDIVRRDLRMFWDLIDRTTGQVHGKVHTHSLKPFFGEE